MNVLGRCAASGIVLFAALFSVVGDAAPVCAAETPRAVLVVDTGESEQRFCVSLPADEVSGIELIELAGDQYGLSYKLGYGGGVVCMLAGVGPTSDDCFEDHPNFWGYWRGDGSGGWMWSSSGAGSTRVGDGDVEGWSWGSGSNGDTHQRPPATAFGDVCARGAKSPQEGPRKPTREEGAAPRRSTGLSDTSSKQPPPPDRDVPAAVGEAAPQPPSEDGGGGRKTRPGRQPKKARASGLSARANAAVAPSPSATDDPPPQAVDPTGSSGPPPAGVAAIMTAALLAGAGAMFARRRRSPGS